MRNTLESAPKMPSTIVRETMDFSNNDWERNIDYRGNVDTLPEGRPTFADGKPSGFSNAAYNNGSHDEHIAEQAPNAYVELANLQNRHDDQERVATLDRMEAIGAPGLSITKRRELGKLVDRMGVIDPSGKMNESHQKFKDANLDALMGNAHAQAAREGIQLNSASIDTSDTNYETDSNPTEHEAKVEALGNVFHEVWLRTRNKRNDAGDLIASGERDVREKKTSDVAWAQRQGQATVDIANTGFVGLPSDWKAENSAAAEVIVDLIEQLGDADAIDLADADTYEAAGTTIHQEWLSRNEYAKGGPLDVPFSELPLDEKDKDLEQLKIALELFRSDKDSARARPFETRALQTVNNWALEKHLPIRSVSGDLIYPETDYYDDQYAALRDGQR